MSPPGHTVLPEFGRIVVVASLGGLQALSTVLAGIPADYPVPIVVAQHRRRTHDGRDLLTAILAGRTALPVRVAEAGAAADRPGITVVPAQSVATVDAAGRWQLTHNVGIRPGDDLLTSSAAHTPTIAVILTGALADGADGCRAVKRAGGRVLVQDPATSRARSMPDQAIATGCADGVLAPDRLAAALLALTTGPGGTEPLAAPPPLPS